MLLSEEGLIEVTTWPRKGVEHGDWTNTSGE